MRILITGASAGIGLSTVEALCEQGHAVVGVARNREKLNDLAGRFEGFTALPCDLASESALADFNRRLGDVLGEQPLDVLINNAGFGAAGPIELVPIAQWKAQFDLNVFGTISVIQAALPFLRRSSGARIINVSSIVSKIYAPYFAPYYASKHALENITDTLRLELKPQGIDVISVRPGAVKTGFANTEDAMLEDFAESSQLYQKSIRQMIRWHQALVKKGGIEPDEVRDVLVKAVTAERPKSRYTVPKFPASVFVPLLQVLPARRGDSMITDMTRFETKPKP